ncbi:hypothetical protein [Candidatus Williamhamiltonella defendens]|uniref:Uncharacterized protein n=1 Tax=Hamiltonella defensa subsp. Acyrthosiphon pisum (strain 5AT) TaxID=572265 RepID=C3M8B7_HAMD5|nr:hypothetical protein [Candidatus Hamiltonella defensa]ACQ68888.1 conserved hypothetical protein HDEF_p0011 [Candidatus Hamiltonella defensa 5AT (Acyrthosiphon pisum)]
MKKKPSLDEFRSGGGEIVKEKSNETYSVSERMNKTIRLRKIFEKKLKENAFHRSMKENRRVTESDIIDEALEKYFDIL